MHALCRESCQRRQKSKYGMSASIDPYGLMTKSGQMKELGAVGLYDFEMEAKLDNWLGVEESKGILYVKERAHIGARYHQAVFYELVPRFWAVNYGQDDNGNVDIGEWFSCNNLPGLEKLAKEDEEAIRTASSHDKAVARRAVIFAIDGELFDSEHCGATGAAAIAQWKMDMENATPLE